MVRCARAFRLSRFRPCPHFASCPYPKASQSQPRNTSMRRSFLASTILAGFAVAILAPTTQAQIGIEIVVAGSALDARLLGLRPARIRLEPRLLGRRGRLLRRHRLRIRLRRQRLCRRLLAEPRLLLQPPLQQFRRRSRRARIRTGRRQRHQGGAPHQLQRQWGRIGATHGPTGSLCP